MIESIRNEGQPLLLLDCGDLFSSEATAVDLRKDTADFMLQAMTLMKYDALNLGAPDFQFGHEFLEQSRSAVSFPYIASNLLYDGDGLPWVREYVIKEVGGIKVAILGIVDPEALASFLKPEEAKRLLAVPPREALKRLVPEVRKKADLVILLSQLSTTGLFALLENIKGIDVSISSGCEEAVKSNPKPEKPADCMSISFENKEPLIAEPPEGTAFRYIRSNKGMSMGLLKIAFDDKRVPLVSESEFVPMGISIPGNEEMAKRVETHKKEMEIKEAERQKELMEGLQLSPQEFMERFQNQQTKK